MKMLKNCVKLSSSVKIYVPSTIDVDQTFDSPEWIDKTLKYLADCFGGSTASKALGAWISTNGELVKERVTVVFSYANQKDLEKNMDEIYSFCLTMKKALGQEAIALEVNNELYFV